MKLYSLVECLKKDLATGSWRKGFGLLVNDLRQQLTEAERLGASSDAELIAGARQVLADLDERYVRKLISRIKEELDLSTRSPGFIHDIARLHRFRDGSRRVWSQDESIALREAIAFLSDLESRGIAPPIQRPSKKTQNTESTRKTKKKPLNQPYRHHPTLDDDYDGEPRVQLILGGAFEMDRRRH